MTTTEEIDTGIVNIASVKQLSPFRYPGGKTWLVPTVKRWLSTYKRRPKEFVDLFCGGGSIGLAVACGRLADHVTMIELDPDVSAVWHCILGNNGDAKWLMNRILEFKMCHGEVWKVMDDPSAGCREIAFKTVLRNRINYGGTLSGSAGVVSKGEGGRGLSSRWYPQTLAARIRLIHLFREKITFIQGDGVLYLEEHIDDAHTLWFMDPPYTAPGKGAGRRLYRYSEVDHAWLFGLASLTKSPFLMTYEDNETVLQLVHQYDFEANPIHMKGNQHKEISELLITKELFTSNYLPINAGPAK